MDCECEDWRTAIKAGHLECLIEYRTEEQEKEVRQYQQLAEKKKQWTILQYLVQTYTQERIYRDESEAIRCRSLSGLICFEPLLQPQVCLKEAWISDQRKMIDYLLATNFPHKFDGNGLTAIQSNNLVGLIQVDQGGGENVFDWYQAAIEHDRLEILQALVEKNYSSEDEDTGHWMMILATRLNRLSIFAYLSQEVTFQANEVYTVAISLGRIPMMRILEDLPKEDLGDYYLSKNPLKYVSLVLESNQPKVIHHLRQKYPSAHYSEEAIHLLQCWQLKKNFFRLVRATLILRRWIRSFRTRYYAPTGQGFRSTQRHFDSLRPEK